MDDVNNIKVVIRKQDRIDYILKGIAGYYDTTVEDIKSRRKNRYMVDRKRIAIVILYDIADCSLKDVSYALGYSQGGDVNVFVHLKNTREDLSSPTQAGRKFKKEYDNVLKYLNL